MVSPGGAEMGPGFFYNIEKLLNIPGQGSEHVRECTGLLSLLQTKYWEELCLQYSFTEHRLLVAAAL